MKESPVGKVIHYYDRLMVAVVRLEKGLSVGDEIVVRGSEGEFKQTVESMEVNHKSIKKAKGGEEVAIKVTEPVKQNYKLFKA